MSNQNLDDRLQRALRPGQTTDEQRKRHQDLLARHETGDTRSLRPRGLAEFGVIAAVAMAILAGTLWWQRGQSNDADQNGFSIAATTSTPAQTATQMPTATSTPTPAPPPTATLEAVSALPPATCPVTTVARASFTPPEPFSSTPPELYSAVWYGSDELWTMVNPEGETWAGLPYDDGFSQKTFWWRAGYSAMDEPRPAITVTGERLDIPGPTFEAGDPGTHGMRVDIGDFMLVGISIPTPGCWEITGHYEGAELSYVVWVTTAR